MKKNVLALSISAALCSLGMVGSAYAITDLGVAASVGTAVTLKGNNDGIGHNLIVPYFTAQGKNATAFTLTNTTSIAKAVKVRFRGAENSDDVLDFQVFLSPYDVWTASVSQAATGEAMITTYDKSCTKPAFTSGTGVSFRTGRLSSAANVAGTREGYIEIFNMADIPAAAAVAGAVTHASGGVPTCSGTAWGLLDTDTTAAVLTGATIGLAKPTTGLVANYILINTATGTSWSGQAAATQALDAGGLIATAGVQATGNLVYWPQMATPVAATNVSGWTADPLLIKQPLNAAAIITATMQDLPDMSTPYISGLSAAAGDFNAAASYNAGSNQWAAKVQASLLTASLAAVTVNNDFYVDSVIGGATDWVFTMPTRRYHAAVAYSGPTIKRTDYTTSDALNPAIAAIASAQATYPATAGAGSNFFDATNTALNGFVICTSGITPTMYNREEATAAGSSVTFSPSTVSAASFCGEAGVWALGQTLAVGGITNVLQSNLGNNVSQGVSVNNFASGWLSVATPGLLDGAAVAKGLPVVGAAFTKGSSDPAKAYGWSQNHAVTRKVGFAY